MGEKEIESGAFCLDFVENGISCVQSFCGQIAGVSVMRVFLIAVLLIAGCGGHLYLEDGIEDLKKKDYQSAYDNFMACFKESEDPGCLHNAGISVALMGDKKAAIELFTLAARYSDPNAIEQLEKMGEPVPAADLMEGNEQPRKMRETSVKQKERNLRCDKFGYGPGTPQYETCLIYMKNEGY